MRRSLAVLIAAGAFAGGAFAVAATDNPGADGVVHACVDNRHQVVVHPDGACGSDETPLDLNQPPIGAAGRAEILARLATIEATIAANDQSAQQLSKAVDALEGDIPLSGFGKEQKRELRKWMRSVRRFARQTDAFAQGSSALNRQFHDMAKSIIQNIRA